MIQDPAHRKLSGSSQETHLCKYPVNFFLNFLRAVDEDQGNGCSHRRGDTIVARGAGEEEGHEVAAATLLEHAGFSLRSGGQRWTTLATELQGSFQITDLVPHEGGLIDRLEKGGITCRQAAREVDSILRKGFSPYGGEALEGVSPRAGVGFLRKVLRKEKGFNFFGNH